MTLNETLKALPPQARQELIDFAEFLAHKYTTVPANVNPNKKKILSFAGSWKEMSDKDFKGFIDEVYERREQSITRRTF